MKTTIVLAHSISSSDADFIFAKEDPQKLFDRIDSTDTGQFVMVTQIGDDGKEYPAYLNIDHIVAFYQTYQP